MRNFAARLINHDAGLRSSAQGTSAAFKVPDRMRTHLTTLMGNGGHRALLMRALALAGAEVRWLREVEVGIDGSLEGLDTIREPVTHDEAFNGGAVLVAHLMGLLVAFIGERLTLQIVREVWPKMPTKDLNFKI
jgi:hypothetical protein